MSQVQKYPVAWRTLHWVIAVLVIVTIPIGLWMVARGEANIWGPLTNTLFSSHKAIGFVVLLLMLIRIGMKAAAKTPPYPDTMPRKLQLAAKGLHHLMYLLLLLTPLLGWAGVTAFPALGTFGGYSLPAMPFIPVNEDLAARLFAIHGTLAMILAVLILGHIGAAFRHMVRRDGVFRRML